MGELDLCGFREGLRIIQRTSAYVQCYLDPARKQSRDPEIFDRLLTMGRPLFKSSFVIWIPAIFMHVLTILYDSWWPRILKLEQFGPGVALTNYPTAGYADLKNHVSLAIAHLLVFTTWRQGCFLNGLYLIIALCAPPFSLHSCPFSYPF